VPVVREPPVVKAIDFAIQLCRAMARAERLGGEALDRHERRLADRTLAAKYCNQRLLQIVRSEQLVVEGQRALRDALRRSFDEGSELLPRDASTLDEVLGRRYAAAIDLDHGALSTCFHSVWKGSRIGRPDRTPLLVDMTTKPVLFLSRYA